MDSHGMTASKMPRMVPTRLAGVLALGLLLLQVDAARAETISSLLTVQTKVTTANFTYNVPNTGGSLVTCLPINFDYLSDYGLQLTDATISCVDPTSGPTKAGSLLMTLTKVSDNTTQTLMLNIAKAVPNVAPVVSSVDVVENPTVLGEAMSFSASASDPDSNTLSYRWIFGDGAQAIGSVAAHTYAASGTYSGSLLVGDGTTVVKTALSMVVVASADFTVTGAKVRFNFKVPTGSDTLTLDGFLPVTPGHSWASKSVKLSLGKASLPKFKLDSKGGASVPTGAFALRMISKTGEFTSSLAKFHVAYAKLSLFKAFRKAGASPPFVNANMDAPITVAFPLTMRFDGQTFTQQITVEYNAIAGQYGQGSK